MTTYKLFWRPEHSAEHAWRLFAETEVYDIAEDELASPPKTLFDRSLLKLVSGSKIIVFGTVVGDRVATVNRMINYVPFSSQFYSDFRMMGADWGKAWRWLPNPSRLINFCMISLKDRYVGEKGRRLFLGIHFLVQQVVMRATGNTKRIGLEMLKEGTVQQWDIEYLSNLLGPIPRVLRGYYQMVLTEEVGRLDAISLCADAQMALCENYGNPTEAEVRNIRRITSGMREKIGLSTAIEDLWR